MLIDPAAQHDLDVPASVRVENGPAGSRLGAQAPAVDAQGLNAPGRTGRSQLVRERSDEPRRTLRVVGIDQERRGAGPALHEIPECLLLRIVSLDERMSQRAREGNAEAAPRFDGRRSLETSEGPAARGE